MIAGPDGRDVFEPAELTVSVGEAVTGGFGSSGHNVSCRPADSGKVELPADAEPFASNGTDGSPLGSSVPQDETFERAFDVAGQYTYVRSTRHPGNGRNDPGRVGLGSYPGSLPSLV